MFRTIIGFMLTLFGIMLMIISYGVNLLFWVATGVTGIGGINLIWSLLFPNVGMIDALQLIYVAIMLPDEPRIKRGRQ